MLLDPYMANGPHMEGFLGFHRRLAGPINLKFLTEMLPWLIHIITKFGDPAMSVAVSTDFYVFCPSGTLTWNDPTVHVHYQ